MLPILFALVMPAPQVFDGLSIELPAPAKVVVADDERKVWTAVASTTYAGGVVQEDHRVTVMITDFAAMDKKGTQEQMLAAHEENFRRRVGYGNVLARRSEGKVGNTKAVMFYGYGSDEKGNSRTLASAGIPSGDKLYEVIWVTQSHRRKVPLESISKITFQGKPVQGWVPTTDGEYSMSGVPFVVDMPGTIGREIWKEDSGYASGYFASAMPEDSKGLDTRFIAVRLKPDDKRSDDQIFEDLARRGMSPFSASDKKPDLSSGSADVTAEIDQFGTKIHVRAMYLRKGSWVGLLTVHGYDTADVRAALKRPTFRYVEPSKT